MTAKLLLVEDDLRLQSVVRRGLEAEGYVVDVAPHGAAALERLRAQPYALVILDRMMPGPDGVEICRAMRAEGVDALVLMLTARGAVVDRIEGLRGGADDYLTKPFAFGELLARIEALLRRPAAADAPPAVVEVGDLRLDPEAGAAWRAGRKIALTRKEFALLDYLARKGGAVAGREELLAKVWNLDFDPGTKVVEVHIRFLRRKIDEGEASPLIRTVRGFGYRLSAED